MSGGIGVIAGGQARGGDRSAWTGRGERWFAMGARRPARGHWGSVPVALLMAVVLAAGTVASTAAAPLRPSVGATPAPAAAGDVGYRDFSYSGVSAPTGQKPESKLWFNQDGWWGILWSSSRKTYSIYRFDWAANTWSDTGTSVDKRNKSDSDALWDASTNKLYVSSHIKEATTTSDMTAILLRYSYDPGTKRYTLDTGYPITLTSGAIEALVIDMDTLGRIWGTWTTALNKTTRQVMFTHSTTDTRTFTPPATLPVSGATTLDIDDISTLVAYNGRIGVMWSNQHENSVYFASHRDGDPDTTWDRNPALQGPKYADDHLNIKSLQADSSGQVFAAVKTSLNDVNPSTSQQPLILLLILDGQGGWQRRTFSVVADNQTRPIVLVDPERRQLYLFASGPCCSGGVVYYKQTSLDNPNFASGPGSPFIKLASDTTINNATSTKQPLRGAPGLLVMAGDDHTLFYVHNRISFTGPPDTTPPNTTIDSGPSGTVDSSSATFTFSSTESGSTFACRLDGGAPTACTSPTTYSGLADGAHGFSVAATDASGNTDATPATAAWTIDTNVPDTTPPTVGLTAPANGAAVRGSVVLAATAQDNVAVARVEFSAAGQLVATDTSAPYTATWDASGTPDGPVAIAATAYDTSGLSATDTHTVTVDTTPPVTTIDSGPSGTVASATATFTFSSSEAGSTFACSLDGAPPTACTSPAAYPGLANGAHAFSVAATDPAGNADPSPATATWTVDAGIATVFSDGFESGDFAAGGWARTIGADGTADVQSATVRSGTFAARLSATTATSSRAYIRRDLGATYTGLTAAADVLIQQEGLASANVPIFRLFDASGVRLISLYRQNLDSSRVYVAIGSTRWLTGVALPLGTWARVELHVVASGTGTSTVEVRVNGVLSLQVTNATLTAGARSLQLGNDTAKQAFAIVADNVLVTQ